MVVVIDKKISPIHPKDDPYVCVNCDLPKARWILENKSWCAGCVLHATEWANDHRDDIIILTNEIEKATKLKMADEGIIYDLYTDRILSSIVFMTKYLGAQNTK